MVPKLAPSIVIIDKNCAVIQYASGKNESSFMQYIDNGMFALSLREGEAVIVDGSLGLDNDNEVLGVTTAEGMPLTRDDFDVVEESINALDVEENLNDDNMNDVDIDVERRDMFFGGVIAPEGYVYIGKLAFICFGPTLKYFAGTLAMGGQSNRSVEKKKEGSRKTQRKVTTERANLDQEVGTNRGLTMQSKMQCAMMAQNEDDADQCHCDMRMVMLSKQNESTEGLVELNLKTSSRMSLGGSEAQVLSSINILMEKLEK
jgi:hypothetical protein